MIFMKGESMNKQLFICENPFQTLVGIIMKHQMFPKDTTDIILTDRSSGFEERYLNLKDIGLFRHVFLFPTSKCHPYKKDKKYYMNQVKCITKGCFLKEMDLLADNYDEIFSLEINCLTAAIVNKHQNNHLLPQINLIDEGFGTYTNIYKKHIFGFHKGRVLIEHLTNTIQHKENILSLIKNIYLFQPELICWDMPFDIQKIQAPNFIQSPDLKKIINYIFEYNLIKKEFEVPYIFFENSTYQDTGDNTDLEFILKIAEIVGKDNLIIKLHPRTQNNRFSQYNIATNSKQGIPWEIIAMNMQDNDNRTFITISSGSVINYRLLFEKKYRNILLYKCLENDFSIDKSVLQFFEKFAEMYPGNIYIPETLVEFTKII